jgi:hypothetical protein
MVCDLNCSTIDKATTNKQQVLAEKKLKIKFAMTEHKISDKQRSNLR